MIKPQNSSQKTYVYIGIVLTSAMVLAAFTYSEKDQMEIELSKVEPIEINYTIEKIKKPVIEKPVITPRKVAKQVATNIKRNVSATSKITKNSMKLLNNNVTFEGYFNG